jgi:hypothetical protein
MRTKPTERTVRGYVTAAAAPTGTGFTVTKTGTGAYQLRFTPPFGAPPNVVASSAQAGSAVANIGSGVDAASAAVVMYVSTTGALVDQPFHFIATGPELK